MRTKTILTGAAITAALGCNPAPASAGLLADVLSGPGGVAGPVIGTTSHAACPVAGGVPVVGDGVCLIGVAAIKYRTTFRRPNGTEIVRTVNGTVDVPSLLNVDDDLLSDLTATLEVTSPDRFVLNIDRALLETGIVPVKVEVLVDDPTGALPRDHIFFGYDSREGRAPKSWDGEIRLLEASDVRTSLGFEISKTGTTGALATVGGLYDGSANDRQNPLAARLKTTAAPDLFAAGLSLANNATLIQAGSPTPTTLQADVEFVDGPSRQEITATIENLPTAVAVAMIDQAGGQQDVIYSASAPVPGVDLRYDGRENGALVEHVEVELDDVPTGLIFERYSKGAGRVAVPSPGSIGAARLLFSTKGHLPAQPPATGAYVAFDTPGEFEQLENAPSALGLRVEHLRSATYNTEGDTTVDVDTASGPQDLHFEARDKNIEVIGTVKQIPRHITAGLTLGGRITYDGHGSTVPEITANAVARTGTLKDRFTTVTGKLLGLPPQLTADIAPDHNSFNIEPSAQVASIEAQSYNGANTCLEMLEGAAGAAVIDTPTRACVGGRFQGLKRASVRVLPLKVDVDAAAPQKALLKGIFDEAGDDIPEGTVDGVIDEIPGKVVFQQAPGFVPGSTSPTFDLETDARIPLVKLSGRNLPASVPFRFVDLKLEGISDDVHVAVPDDIDEQRIVATADGGIDLIEVDLSNGTAGCLDKLFAASGASLVDTPSTQCVSGRFRGLTEANIGLAPLDAQVKATAGQKLYLTGRIDDPEDDVTGEGRIEGHVDALPSSFRLRQTPGYDGPGRDTPTSTFKITNNTAISSVKVNGSNLPEAFPSRFLDAELKGIPAAMDDDPTRITVSAGGAFRKIIDAHVPGTGIDLVTLDLRNAGPAIGLPDKEDTVRVLEDQIAVRVHNLTGAEFRSPLIQSGSLRVAVDHSETARPLTVEVDKDGAAVDVYVPDPPQQVSFERTGTEGFVDNQRHPDRMFVRSSGPIPAIDFRFARPNLSLEVKARDIPKTADLCIFTGSRPFNSGVSTIDPTWCYSPAKTKFDDGGDPFAAVDDFQMTVDNPEGGLATPIKLDRLAVNANTGGDVSTTTVTDVVVGEITVAVGANPLHPIDGQIAQQADLYGKFWDSDPDPVVGMPNDPTDNEVIHLALNTDDHGFKGRVLYEANRPSVVGNHRGYLDFETETPLHATNKLNVTDGNSLAQDSDRGTLSGCSADPYKFNLALDVADTFDFPLVGAPLADFLDCTLL